MSEKEMQEIISLLFETLSSNSLTIDQLLHTNVLRGEDYVELNQGRKASLSDIKSFIAYNDERCIDVLKKKDERIPSDNNVFSAIRTLLELANNNELLKKMFLRKDQSDFTRFLLMLLAGARFGDFIPGISGAIIDQFGDGEMGSLVLRKFLSVPELRYNRVTVFKGKQIISPGGGCLIESFTMNGDGTWTIVPKLEEGEPLSQFVDDIMLAYWHDKDVQTGVFKGFREMKFRVISVDNDAKTLVIAPKPGSLSVPAIAMTLAQVGNFTNTERQTYIIIDSTQGNNNITFFDDCNTWDVEENQEKSWFGKKRGRTVAGIDASPYSAVLQNIIMSGLIFQIDEISGDMMRVPCDKGAYVAGKPYAYYDRVSHIGALWLCINDKGTDTAPADGNVNWLKQVSEGKPGTPGESIKMLGHWNSSMRPVAANCMVSYAKGIYLSLRETNQAPVSTLMYADGSYMTNETGGYILASDEVNEDWEMILENGKNGVSILFQGSFPSAPDNPKDGWSYYNTTDKRSYVYQGDKWYVTAIDGKDGKDFEWIYTRTTTNDKPAALESIQEDDYVPPGWTDDPQGCTVELPFEWICKRVKKDGVWQPFSAASIFNMYVVGETGPAGITPCGHWQSANVPYKKTSLVTLYNATFVALVDTSSPPLWLMKWGSGPTDYLTNSTGGYIPLGGVENNLNPEWLMLTPPPVNGNDSTSYWLTAPVSTININSVGSLSPSAVWVSCKKKTGAGAVTDCADYYLAARKYNGSWLAHVSPVKASSLSVSAVGGYTQFTVRAYNSESEANSWSSGFVSEIGIGVSKDGATGDTGPAGSFPRDRGEFVAGTSYVWSPSYRDKILYPFDGIYYNFLVGNFGATVTAAPTSASGDGLWEAMGKYKSIATDTLFADGANVALFMFKNGILRSQDETGGVPNIILNGKTGYARFENVEIRGVVHATSGSFSGQVNALSGKIGGFTIENGSLWWKGRDYFGNDSRSVRIGVPADNDKGMIDIEFNAATTGKFGLKVIGSNAGGACIYASRYSAESDRTYPSYGMTYAGFFDGSLFVKENIYSGMCLSDKFGAIVSRNPDGSVVYNEGIDYNFGSMLFRKGLLVRSN